MAMRCFLFCSHCIVLSYAFNCEALYVVIGGVGKLPYEVGCFA